MAQYGDPEGTFSSIKTAAEPGDVTAYRTTPQFAVSVGKFAVMSLCTFGFYELYWAYKHWDAMRRREQERLSPFWRAFFAPLWGFQSLTAAAAAHRGLRRSGDLVRIRARAGVLPSPYRVPPPRSTVAHFSAQFYPAPRGPALRERAQSGGGPGSAAQCLLFRAQRGRHCSRRLDAPACDPRHTRAAARGATAGASLHVKDD